MARGRVAGGQRLTARQLNRATLARQLLLGRERLGVVDAVRRIVAIQAQEPASPYIALWNRVEGFDPAHLDGAFRDRSVLKASLLRVTLHAVHADDYPVFHRAMQTTLRGARLGDARFKRSGLTSADADALLPALREFASEGRTNAQVDAWLDQHLGEHPKPSIWWALRQSGPFVHAPTGGPWAFGPRPSYSASPERPETPAAIDPELALQSLVRRYLEGFGPASLADIAQFTVIYRSIVRPAVDALRAELRTFEGPDGVELLDVRDGVIPDADTPAPPRLMAMWDSVLLAHADRSRIIPPDVRKDVIRTNGDVLPTVLVDGFVAGVWRPVDDGIEVTAFESLPDETWAGLESEAGSLTAFLAPRESSVYRRYARWWPKLPKGEVRVLGTEVRGVVPERSAV